MAPAGLFGRPQCPMSLSRERSTKRGSRSSVEDVEHYPNFKTTRNQDNGWEKKQLWDIGAEEGKFVEEFQSSCMSRLDSVLRVERATVVPWKRKSREIKVDALAQEVER